MTWQHFLLARDDSDAGVNAERIGIELATLAHAAHTTLTVVPAPAMAVTGSGANGPSGGVMGAVVTHGVASIEICRFAEEHNADLIVLGRKTRNGVTRLLRGDTADAVARRSLIPTLHVPPEAHRFATMLVALDGSERGLAVLRAARSLAHQLGISLRVVTVESVNASEAINGGYRLPTGRTHRLVESVEALGLAGNIIIRRGDPVTEIQDVVAESGADLLVVGYRRGGPPAEVEAGSVARRLVHIAPCTVLTIPL